MRKKAQMYKGQKLTANAVVIAQKLDVPVEEVQQMDIGKRYRTSALLDIDKSEYMGETALRTRELSRAINDGDLGTAENIINAADDAVRAAELEFPLPPKLEWVDDVEFKDDGDMTMEGLEARMVGLKLPEAPLSYFDLRAEGEKVGVPETTMEALEKRFALLHELGEGMTTYCGTGIQAEKSRMIEEDKRVLGEGIRRRKLEAELKALQNNTLEPNLERQAQIRENLAKGKNRAEMEELEGKFTYLDKKLETMAEVLNNVYSDGQANLSLNRKMNSNMRDLTKQQQEYFVKTMKTLTNIDLKVSDTRMKRQVGFTNAYGLAWLAKDNFNVIVRGLFTEDGKFSPSMWRAARQALEAAITAIEVVLKNMQGLARHLYKGLECLKKTTVGCLVQWGLKTLLFCVVALGIYLIAKTCFPTLTSYMTWMLNQACELLKICGERLKVWCENTVMSDEFQKNYAEFMIQFKSKVSEIYTNCTPQVLQDLFSGISAIVAGLWTGLTSFYNTMLWLGGVSPADTLTTTTPSAGADTSWWWPFSLTHPNDALVLSASLRLPSVAERPEETEVSAEELFCNHKVATLRQKHMNVYGNLRF